MPGMADTPAPVKIEALVEFKHDRTHYEAGEVYDVDLASAAYFVGNRWARDVDGVLAHPAEEAPPEAENLLVHDVETTLDAEGLGEEEA